MANALVEALAAGGVDFVAAFASSGMSKSQQQIEQDPRFDTVFPSNEGEGVAICAGAYLAGRKPAILMENSGFLLSAYQLMRLHAANEIPVLMVLDHRGGFGEGNWWAVPLGWSTQPALDALRIPHAMADTAADVTRLVPGMVKSMLHTKVPCCLILRRGIELE